MTPANGTYKQPGRRRAPRALVRNEKGQFVTKGGERRQTGNAGAETLKEKAVELFKVMRVLTKTAPSKALRSRAFPYPIYRAVMYDRLYKEGFSTCRIGSAFGKDHCTVRHAILKLHELLEVGDKEVTAIYNSFNAEIEQLTKTNDMSKLFFTEVSFAGGMRKVEADIWPTMTETFRHAIVAEEHLETLKANLEQLVEKRAAELKVKAVPVTLSPEWNKLKDATLPRFLSVGRITVTLTEVRRVIGKDNEEAAV